VREEDIYRHALLTPALDGGKSLASSPGRYTPEEKSPGKYWGREADQFQPSTEVKNAWSFITTVPILIHGMVPMHRDNRTS